MSALDLAVLPVFVAVTAIICLAPGPDMVYMVGSGLSGGRGAALRAGIGVTLGVSVYVAVTAFGLAAVVARWPLVLIALQIVGALYLLWLAWTTLRSARAEDLAQTVQLDAGANWFRRGLVVNLTNPKPMLFFLAFLPQFIGAADNRTLQLIMLGLIFQVIGLVVDLAAGLAAGMFRNRVLGRPGLVRAVNVVSAAVFACLAVYIGIDLVLQYTAQA